MENYTFFIEHLDTIWKSAVLFFAALFLLRLSGRKTIADMTIAHVVIMIGLGSLLVQPVASQELPATLIAGAVLVLAMIITDFSQLKLNVLETLIQGKSKIVIENGRIHEGNLRKLRLTVDTLEMKLRQKGIATINDVEFATLEISGNLGYKLKPNKQPATIEEIEQLIDKKLTQFIAGTPKQRLKFFKPEAQTVANELEKMIDAKIRKMIVSPSSPAPSSDQDIFREIAENKHDVDAPPPEHLH